MAPSSPPPPQKSPSPPEAPRQYRAYTRPSPFRSLAARLVLQTADRLVVEFEVPEEGFDWSPGASAKLKLADGELVEVQVDLTTSTAPGELRAGTIVRLVLRLKRPLTAKQVPASVALPTASLELVFSPGSP